ALTQAAEAAQIGARGEYDVDVLDGRDPIDDLDAGRVLDHCDDHDVVVRLLAIVASPQRAVLTAALAAFAERRVHRELDRVLDLIDGVDHRDDDAERADVDGLLNVAFGGIGYAYERNGGPRADANHLRNLSVGQGAMLHLDPEEIEARVRHRAIDVDVGDRNRPAHD